MALFEKMALLGIFGIFGIFGHEDVNFRNNFGVQFSIFSKIVIFAKNAKNGHFWVRSSAILHSQ